MKTSVPRILVAVNVALALLLLFMWVDTSGRLRNVHWNAPKPIKPDLASLVPSLLRPGGDNMGKAWATLERPVFAQSRRPPDVAASVAASAADPLASIQLVGVYGGRSGGGIIARVDNKVRRAVVGDKIGEWTVAQVADREVTFVRGTERRAINLRGPKPAQAPGAAPATQLGTPVTLARPATSAPAPVPPRQTAGQTPEEFERERLRYINELNAQNGLPPVNKR